MWDPSQLKEAHIPIGNWVGLGWAVLGWFQFIHQPGWALIGLVSIHQSIGRREEREGSFFIFGYYSVLEA